MNQSLDQLEINVYQLAQKFETLIGENKRLQEKIEQQKLEQEQQKRAHEAAVDELSEALLVTVNELKTDLQTKIEQEAAEKERYRTALVQATEQIQRLIARLPQEKQD